MIALACLLSAVLVATEPLTSREREDFAAAITRQLEGKWEEAVSRYRRLLDRRPGFVPGRIYLAESLWLAGNRDKALGELDASRSAAPGLLLPILLRSQFGEMEEAGLKELLPDPGLRARLVEAFRLDREKFVSVGRPSLLLVSWGAVEIALKDYRYAAELDPGNPDLHREMGAALFKARRPLEAAQAFKEVVALELKDGASWRHLGSSYLMLMWWDSAIGAFQKALALEGERPPSLLALGYAFERKPDVEQALGLYRQASKLAPSWAQPHYRMGRVLMRINRLDEAEAAFKKAVELHPKMVEAVCFLGALYLQKGDLAPATRVLEHATGLNPRYPKSHYYLGQVYRRSGREADARRALAEYEKLQKNQIEVDPDSGPHTQILELRPKQKRAGHHAPPVRVSL